MKDLAAGQVRRGEEAPPRGRAGKVGKRLGRAPRHRRSSSARVCASRTRLRAEKRPDFGVLRDWAISRRAPPARSIDIRGIRERGGFGGCWLISVGVYANLVGLYAN